MLSLSDVADRNHVRSTIASSALEQDWVLCELRKKDCLMKRDLDALRNAMHVRICDEVLMLYFDQDRLDAFDRLRDAPLKKLLAAVQSEIAEVFSVVESLEKREDLADSHLLSLVKRSARRACTQVRMDIRKQHLSVDDHTLMTVAPMPEIADLLLVLAAHLREIHVKVLPENASDFASLYPEDGFYENR
jgi:hypothetical protein